MDQRLQRIARNDKRIIAALTSGYLQVDTESGLILGKTRKPVGSLTAQGYLKVGLPLPGSPVYAHRIVWLAAHGEVDPAHQVNHRNKVRHDNRIANLELLTDVENLGHQHGNLSYVGVRPEDVAAVSSGRPDWYERALVLAASGTATPADVAALRAEVTFTVDPLNPISQYQRTRGLRTKRSVRVSGGGR